MQVDYIVPLFLSVSVFHLGRATMDLVERRCFPSVTELWLTSLCTAELAKQASQISMYDIKSYYNQAKNAVLNVSEMEAKVREATNDDSW